MRGRKAWQVTPEVLQTITEMVSRGVTESSIASHFGIDKTTFQRHKNNNPDIVEAIKEGKQCTKDYAASKMISIMMDDNHPKMFNALQFYLKTQGGWSETRNIVVPDVPAPSSIRFELDEEDD